MWSRLNVFTGSQTEHWQARAVHGEPVVSCHMYMVVIYVHSAPILLEFGGLVLRPIQTKRLLGFTTKRNAK